MRKLLKKINDGLELFSDGSLFWLKSGDQLQGITLSHVTASPSDFIYLRGASIQETREPNVTVQDLPISQDQKMKPVPVINDNDAAIAALEGGS